eukprot:4139931-Alexandrium_andersonii.AAC.1
MQAAPSQLGAGRPASPRMNGALRPRLRPRHRRALSPASRRRPRADGRPNRGTTARRPSLPTA